LFVIDPRPYEAAVDRANANLIRRAATETMTSAESTAPPALLKTQFSRAVSTINAPARAMATAKCGGRGALAKRHRRRSRLR